MDYFPQSGKTSSNNRRLGNISKRNNNKNNRKGGRNSNNNNKTVEEQVISLGPQDKPKVNLSRMPRNIEGWNLTYFMEINHGVGTLQVINTDVVAGLKKNGEMTSAEEIARAAWAGNPKISAKEQSLLEAPDIVAVKAITTASKGKLSKIDESTCDSIATMAHNIISVGDENTLLGLIAKIQEKLRETLPKLVAMSLDSSTKVSQRNEIMWYNDCARKLMKILFTKLDEKVLDLKPQDLKQSLIDAGVPGHFSELGKWSPDGRDILGSVGLTLSMKEICGKVYYGLPEEICEKIHLVRSFGFYVQSLDTANNDTLLFDQISEGKLKLPPRGNNPFALALDHEESERLSLNVSSSGQTSDVRKLVNGINTILEESQGHYNSATVLEQGSRFMKIDDFKGVEVAENRQKMLDAAKNPKFQSLHRLKAYARDTNGSRREEKLFARGSGLTEEDRPLSRDLLDKLRDGLAFESYAKRQVQAIRYDKQDDLKRRQEDHEAFMDYEDHVDEFEKARLLADKLGTPLGKKKNPTLKIFLEGRNSDSFQKLVQKKAGVNIELTIQTELVYSVGREIYDQATDPIELFENATQVMNGRTKEFLRDVLAGYEEFGSILSSVKSKVSMSDEAQQEMINEILYGQKERGETIENMQRILLAAVRGKVNSSSYLGLQMNKEKAKNLPAVKTLIDRVKQFQNRDGKAKSRPGNVLKRFIGNKFFDEADVSPVERANPILGTMISDLQRITPNSIAFDIAKNSILVALDNERAKENYDEAELFSDFYFKTPRKEENDEET